MTTSAVTATPGGEAPEAPHASHVNRIAVNRVGLWLFFFSDGLLFAAFAASRFYLHGTGHPPEVKQWLGLAITAVLLVSSLTAYRGETAIVHGNLRHGRLMLLATILLGAAFAVGVGIEWSIAEWAPSDAYGTSFFSMTGIHAMHVVTGVIFLIVIWVRAGKGHFPVGNTWPVTAMVMYWHFVDVVWVFFYPTLYLVR
jgi:cytochrome c oxidase subunit 3